jgi:hypothetical protein
MKWTSPANASVNRFDAAAGADELDDGEADGDADSVLTRNGVPFADPDGT